MSGMVSVCLLKVQLLHTQSLDVVIDMSGISHCPYPDSRRLDDRWSFVFCSLMK